MSSGVEIVAVTDGLIGNLLKNFEPLFAAVKEFAEIPDLGHGKPLIEYGNYLGLVGFWL